MRVRWPAAIAAGLVAVPMFVSPAVAEGVYYAEVLVNLSGES